MLRTFFVILAARGTKAILTTGSGASGHLIAALSAPSEDLARATTQLQVSRGATDGQVPVEDIGVDVGVPGTTARRRRRSLPLVQLQHMAKSCNGGVLSASGAPCHPSTKQQGERMQTQKRKPHPVAEFALGSSGEFAFRQMASPLPPAPAALGSTKQLEFLKPNNDMFTGLLLELHLPGATLQQLHSAAHGSLADFLRRLQGDLGTAAHIEPRQITILGIHGRYRRVDPAGTERGFPMPKHVDEEVLVKFEVLRLQDGGLDEAAVISSLQQGLASQQSQIMHGTLGTILKNGTITRSLAAGDAQMPTEVRSDRASQVSAIFLPIGVSAAFTGILIWLAAW